MKEIKTYLLIITFFFALFCTSNEESNNEIEVYFSPTGGIKNAIIENLNNAKTTVNIAMYAFTNRELAQAVISTVKRGIEVKVLLSPSDDPYSKAEYLSSNGVNVKIYNKHTEDNGIMHNKFAIIDGKTTITGSYNWTASAEERNDENIVIIYNQNVSSKFLAKFNELWNNSDPLFHYSETNNNIVLIKNRDELLNHLNTWTNLKGKVFSVGYSYRSGIYFLNMHEQRDYFTVIIYPEIASNLIEKGVHPKSLKGKTILVSGKIFMHEKHGLEIVLNSSNDLTIYK